MGLQDRYISYTQKSMFQEEVIDDREDITEEMHRKNLIQDQFDDMNIAMEEGIDLFERGARSAAAAVAGSPGEVEKLAKFAGKVSPKIAAPQYVLAKELFKMTGNEYMTKVMDELLEDTNKIQVLEEFFETMDSDTVLPDIQDVKQMMTDKLGFEFKNDIAELLAEIAAPTGYGTRFVKNIFQKTKSKLQDAK